MTRDADDTGAGAIDGGDLCELLWRERPRASAHFVEDLRGRLPDRAPAPRPQRLHALVALYSGSGALLLALAAAAA